MKVAIVHYWFVSSRGGEKVIEALLSMFPEADLFCHVYNNNVSKKITDRIKETSFIGKLPFAEKYYQSYLPFMPLALEQLDLSEYDLVISSESGPAKGVVVAPNAVHVCYCHSPMRYVWDMYHLYTKSSSFPKRIFMALVMHYLRIWDVTAASRVTFFVANSRFVSQRILKYYNRASDVINPPVSVERFGVSEEAGEYYLMVGQLVKYKRPDLAVDAFNQNGKELVVVGDGPFKKHCEQNAKKNIKFLGRLSDKEIENLYKKCKALIFPGEEDFGIVPLEAMASGKPVIAYAKGGALETIVDGETGCFFYEQTSQSLNEAVESFEGRADGFNANAIRSHAEKYSEAEFIRKFRCFLEDKNIVV